MSCETECKHLDRLERAIKVMIDKYDREFQNTNNQAEQVVKTTALIIFNHLLDWVQDEKGMEDLK